MKILVLHGPNLNLFGRREPHIYGTMTLAEINDKLQALARELKVELDILQSNHEGDLVDWLHEAHFAQAKAVLLNAAAYTHTSIALLDAIKSIKVPVIEVHISDPTVREEFRRVSFIGMGAVDTVQGLGARSYVHALEKAMAL